MSWSGVLEHPHALPKGPVALAEAEIKPISAKRCSRGLFGGC
ncbi:hypothetical protein AB0C21_27910 [Spirillospora sp. NPDC049024]